MGLENIRAITLDLYGTTLDVESSVLRAFSDFLKSNNFAGDPAELVRAWTAGYFQEMLIDTLLGQGRTPFEDISRATLGRVLTGHNVAHTAQDLEDILASRDQGVLYPDVAEGLEELRPRYTIAVLSNGDLASLERAVRNMSIPAEAVISAERAGVYKPHPKVYQTAVEQLGLEKDQVLHVAAHDWDIRGARAYGIHGAYINRHGAPYGEFPHQPDLEVSSFVELAQRLP